MPTTKQTVPTIKQTGRYFAPTIAKIRTFKAKERIDIDKKFRENLRAGILKRATGLNIGRSPSFWGNSPWLKQYFGPIVAFGLLLITLAGLSRLPIEFKSRTAIETAPTATQTVDQTQFAAPSLKQSQTVQQEPPSITGNQITTPSVPAISENAPISTALPAKPKNQPQTQKPTVPAQPPVAPGTANIDVPSQTQKYPQPAAVPITAPIITPPTSTFPSQPPAPYYSPVPQPQPGPAQPPPPNSPSAQEAPPASTVPIYFQGRFSNDERTLLENDIIPKLIRDKNALYVNVRETPNEGYAAIEIYLSGDDMETHIYSMTEHRAVN